MSGGHFDYKQYEIDRIADEVEQLIRTNGEEKFDGEVVARNYSPEVVAEFRKGLEALRQAAIYTHRIDWLLCCDDGEDSFLSRLASDMAKLQSRRGPNAE
jgi:hypothetical protein